MKSLKLCIAVLSAACLAQSQEPAKTTVALSSPGQPVTIKLKMISGNVTVKGGTGQQVVVESAEIAARARRRETAVPPGMHRIEMGEQVGVVEDHNVVTIRPGLPGRNEHITIEAPANSSLELKVISCGKVDVSGITGEIDVECTNGAIELAGVTGSVVAHTINGSIRADFDRVAPDKPMSFTSFNGKVEVTLPADTKARLRLKSRNGEVYTDFDVKLESEPGKPPVEDGKGKGKYRIVMNRGVYGSINGGGPEYVFQTMNGDIVIHKK